VPVGAAAGQRKADAQLRRDAVVGAGRKAVGARGQILRAGHQVAVGLVDAAVGRAPHRPALRERRGLRLHRHRGGVGVGDLARQRLALRGIAGRRAEAAAPVGERVEQQ